MYKVSFPNSSLTWRYFACMWYTLLRSRVSELTVVTKCHSDTYERSDDICV